jgi:hypothetical protein
MSQTDDAAPLRRICEDFVARGIAKAALPYDPADNGQRSNEDAYRR